jgi:hypothetical protein
MSPPPAPGLRGAGENDGGTLGRHCLPDCPLYFAPFLAICRDLSRFRSAGLDGEATKNLRSSEAIRLSECSAARLAH